MGDLLGLYCLLFIFLFLLWLPIWRIKLYNNIRDANMFYNRVINFWNKLSDSVVLAASISSFKRRLLSFVVNVGFEQFSVN